MNKETERVVAIIKQHLIFDESIYPDLKGKSTEERFTFALHHSTLHFAKRLGNIASIIEDADHGSPVNIEDLKKQIPKSIIDTLRLAGIVGLSWEDITTAIENHYKNLD